MAVEPDALIPVGELTFEDGIGLCCGLRLITGQADLYFLVQTIMAVRRGGSLPDVVEYRGFPYRWRADWMNEVRGRLGPALLAAASRESEIDARRKAIEARLAGPDGRTKPGPGRPRKDETDKWRPLDEQASAADTADFAEPEPTAQQSASNGTGDEVRPARKVAGGRGASAAGAG